MPDATALLADIGEIDGAVSICANSLRGAIQSELPAEGSGQRVAGGDGPTAYVDPATNRVIAAPAKPGP